MAVLSTLRHSTPVSPVIPVKKVACKIAYPINSPARTSDQVKLQLFLNMIKKIDLNKRHNAVEHRFKHFLLFTAAELYGRILEDKRKDHGAAQPSKDEVYKLVRAELVDAELDLAATLLKM